MAAKKSALGNNPLDQIIPSSKRSTRGPHEKQRVRRPPGEVGCKAGYTRKTIHVNKELFEKIEAIAYWDRLDIKDVVERAFTDYLKGRRVKPKPKAA